MIVTALIKDGVCTHLIQSDVLEAAPEGYEAVKLPDGVALTPPLPGYSLKYPEWQWVDTRSLKTLQEDAYVKIQKWRDAQEASPFVFEHSGREWDGGLVTRQRLQPVTNLPQLPDGFFWTDAANNDVPMNIESLKQLNAAHEQALVIKGFEIHAQQRAWKNAVAMATSKEAIDAALP